MLALGALFWVAVLGQGSGSLRLAVTFGRLSGVGGGLGRCCAWCFLDIKYVVGGVRAEKSSDLEQFVKEGVVFLE